MSNSLVNTRDQKFVLFEQIGIEKLFAYEKYADYSAETVEMMLNEAEKLAVEAILPTYDVGDKDHAQLKDGKAYAPKCFHEPYKKFCEGGWLMATKSPEIGGQGMPLLLWSACMELFNSANFAFMMYPGLGLGAAALIDNYGTEEQKNKYMFKMLEGKWGGTMCLTEPGAGSDVGALRTSAKRRPDGLFDIIGTKSFISSGDHDLTENIIHPVLARIEGDPLGTGGISIFIVPKYRVKDDGNLGEFNDVVTGNLEHKMGIHGNATATLNFGDNGKCVGELLGPERAGMKIMFLLMNEARLEVGMQGLGHATAALEHAIQYAKERIQSKPVWAMRDPNAPAVPIIQHPDVRRTLLWMKAHVEGMRAMNYWVSYCIDMEHTAKTPQERAKWEGFVELLTPVCKAYCSDKGFDVCSFAIDVYGGYGYIQEYPVEQYLRDCKIASLYEGTNGIQALDLVGRKLGMNKGQNAMNLFGEISATVAKAKTIDTLKSQAQRLEEAYNAMVGLTMQFADWGKGSSFLLPIMNARPYLMNLGDLVVGWQLMQGAVVAEEKLQAIYAKAGADGSKAQQRALARENKDVAFYQGKVSAARYFADTVLPTLAGRCTAIQYGNKAPIEMLEESFTI